MLGVFLRALLKTENVKIVMELSVSHRVLLAGLLPAEEF